MDVASLIQECRQIGVIVELTEADNSVELTEDQVLELRLELLIVSRKLELSKIEVQSVREQLEEVSRKLKEKEEELSRKLKEKEEKLSRKLKEEELSRKRKEEEVARKLKEEELSRKLKEEELSRKRKEEEVSRKLKEKEEELSRKLKEKEEELSRKLKEKEEELSRKLKEKDEEVSRKRKEEEVSRKRKEEEVLRTNDHIKCLNDKLVKKEEDLFARLKEILCLKAEIRGLKDSGGPRVQNSEDANVGDSVVEAGVGDQDEREEDVPAGTDDEGGLVAELEDSPNSPLWNEDLFMDSSQRDYGEEEEIEDIPASTSGCEPWDLQDFQWPSRMGSLISTREELDITRISEVRFVDRVIREDLEDDESSSESDDTMGEDQDQPTNEDGQEERNIPRPEAGASSHSYTLRQRRKPTKFQADAIAGPEAGASANTHPCRGRRKMTNVQKEPIPRLNAGTSGNDHRRRVRLPPTVVEDDLDSTSGEESSESDENEDFPVTLAQLKSFVDMTIPKWNFYFNYKLKISRHLARMRRKHPQKPFHRDLTKERTKCCPKCPRSYKFSSALSVHKKFCTGEPYRPKVPRGGVRWCPVKHCSRLFSRRSRFLKHMKKHVDYKPTWSRIARAAGLRLVDEGDS